MSKFIFYALPHYTKKKTPILSIEHFPPVYIHGVKAINRDIRIILFGRTYHVIFGKKVKGQEK